MRGFVVSAGYTQAVLQVRRRFHAKYISHAAHMAIKIEVVICRWSESQQRPTRRQYHNMALPCQTAKAVAVSPASAAATRCSWATFSGNIMILALMILIFLSSQLEGLVMLQFFRNTAGAFTRDTILYSLLIWVVIALGILVPYRYIRMSP